MRPAQTVPFKLIKLDYKFEASFFFTARSHALAPRVLSGTCDPVSTFTHYFRPAHTLPFKLLKLYHEFEASFLVFFLHPTIPCSGLSVGTRHLVDTFKHDLRSSPDTPQQTFSTLAKISLSPSIQHRYLLTITHINSPKSYPSPI